MKILVSNRKLPVADCDNCIFAFSQFIDEAIIDGSLSSFNKQIDRLDEFYFSRLGSKSNTEILWRVIKSLLILSHGQANVERGFSINKQVEAQNLQEKSIVAKRIIIDHISSIGGIEKVVISSQLLMSASSARHQYELYLDEEKKKKEGKQQTLKRKTEMDAIEELKKKRSALEKDIAALNKAADDFAEDAEKKRQITLITKSNSLRKTAKDKTVELQETINQLDSKCLELKK